LGVGAFSAAAQEGAPGKRVEVLPFDQVQVQAQVEETFGGEYDLGRGIANLVRARLSALGVDTVTGGHELHGSVSGTIIVFGKAEGRGDVAGVRVGGVRVGLGRRQEKSFVVLEAQLTDVASGEMLVMVTGRGESDKGGMELFARTRGGTDLATMDLSGEAFKKTSLGDATHRAVDELSKGILEAAGRLGTIARAVAPPPEPVVAAEPSAPAAPVVAGAPVSGPFAWAPYMFKGTEHFRYDVNHTEDGRLETGFYQLDFEPVSQGRVRMRVQGKVGTESFSSTVTTGVGPSGMQMGMGQMMALGPVGILLFNPAGWFAFQGRELTVGDEWSWSSDGDQVSFKVVGGCGHAGQSGVLVTMSDEKQVTWESCVAPDVALPLRMVTRDGDTTMEIVLVEYRP
jgi:hypothetical protein